MRKFLLPIAMLWTAIASAANPQVFSATAAYALDVPQLPLEHSLQRLADLTDIKVSYQPRDVASKLGNQLQGSMPVDTALNRLLFGTGLTYTLDRNTGEVQIVSMVGEAPKGQHQLVPYALSTASSAVSAVSTAAGPVVSSAAAAAGTTIAPMPSGDAIMSQATGAVSSIGGRASQVLPGR